MANGTLTELLDSLDTDAHRRGKQFEKIVKWWLLNDTARSRNIKTVWLWDEWEDRPGRDIGVDLVAEFLDGSLCAIQAKCFDLSRDIPKSEIDSFISASPSGKFQSRMLIATTSGLSANARRTISENQITFVGLNNLLESDVKWPESPDVLPAQGRLPPLTPMPHQQDALKDVLSGFAASARGQLVLPCGTGKTLISLLVHESLQSTSTVIFLPTLALLAQTVREWTRSAQRDWSYLCVCSDESVVERAGEDSSMKSVTDLPFRVTTNPDYLTKFLELGIPSVWFATYHSAPRIASAVRNTNHQFDLIICDEAHRVAGFRESAARLPLDNSAIPAKRRLFQTATPRVYSPAAKQKSFDRGVEPISMDAIEIFGPVFHQMSLRDAIDKSLLADYEVLVLGCSSAEATSLIRERELIEVENLGIVSADELALHVALTHAQLEYGLHRTISFHSRVSRATEFADRHQTLLRIGGFGTNNDNSWSTAISGYMSTRRRTEILRRLVLTTDGYGLVTNSRCLSEGVDVPELDAVLFVDPRRSTIDIIQAIGRAIRRKSDGRIGRIIVPVVIGEDIDGEPTLESAGFQRIIDVVAAMRTHDDQLGEELDVIRFKLGKRVDNQPELPNHIRFQFPGNLSEKNSNLLSKVRLEVLDGTSSSWEYWFGELTRFTEIYGHARPNKRNPGLGHPFIGTWVVNQRRAKRGGWLNQQRQMRLESLPGWSWNQRGSDVAVEDHYRLVREYVIENGELPEIKNRTRISYKGQDLVEAVSWLRRYLRSGKMSTEWKTAISSLPGWSWNTSNDESWETGYRHLVNFVSREGHADVPQYHKERGFELGVWVANQRKDKRTKGRDVRQDRRLRLESLPGWTWNHLDASFFSFFEALRSFHEREGHYIVPKSHNEDGVNLGYAIKNLRRAFRSGRLSSERIQLVETLPKWEWEPKVQRRPTIERRMADRNIQVLTWYSSLENRPKPKKASHLGVTVAQAIEAIRKQIRANVLSDAHRAQLLQLDPHIVNLVLLPSHRRMAARNIQVLTWYSSLEVRPPIRRASHLGVTVAGVIKSLQKQIRDGHLADEERAKLLGLNLDIVNQLLS